MNGEHLSEDDILAYALGELPEDGRRSVESHLVGCAACGVSVRRLLAAIDAYRAADAPGPPAGILVDLLDAQRTSRDRRWRFLRWPMPVATTVAAALLVGFFFTGFWAGRQTAVARVPDLSARADTTAVHRPLPPAPDIPFETALAGDNGRAQ